MYTNLFEKLLAKEEKLSLVGLGYVGMPIAVAFAKKIDVVGLDLNAKKMAASRAMIISNAAETIPARHETEYRFIKAAMNIILLS